MSLCNATQRPFLCGCWRRNVDKATAGCETEELPCATKEIDMQVERAGFDRLFGAGSLTYAF